jgi:Leucine-rich repeat (LRR) protein
VLRTLKGLKNLSIWGNPLRRLPDWIGELTSLESLLVNGCDLDALPDNLFALPRLRELDISENPRLTRLPERFGDLKALEYLKAYRCGLDSLPDSLGRLPRLKELFIAGNRLTAIPKSVRQARLEILSLAGNPIRRGFFGPRFRARKIHWR